MENKEKRRFAWGVTVAALAFLSLSCAGRMEAPSARVNPGVCRDSVMAEARGMGADILYNYVNLNMMTIRIPDTTTIEQAVAAMPSFRGGFMPDKILDLHNDER